MNLEPPVAIPSSRPACFIFCSFASSLQVFSWSHWKSSKSVTTFKNIHATKKSYAIIPAAPKCWVLPPFWKVFWKFECGQHTHRNNWTNIKIVCIHVIRKIGEHLIIRKGGSTSQHTQHENQMHATYKNTSINNNEKTNFQLKWNVHNRCNMSLMCTTKPYTAITCRNTVSKKQILISSTSQHLQSESSDLHPFPHNFAPALSTIKSRVHGTSLWTTSKA